MNSKRSKIEKSDQKELVNFSELLRQSNFDDSVRSRHQENLRVEFLQACDERKNIESDEEEFVSLPNARWYSTKISLAAASVAACVLAVTWFWIASGVGSKGESLSQEPPTVTTNLDPQLVATLTVVDTLRNEFPPELFYEALASCQHEHQARLAESEMAELRWIHESSLSNLVEATPKG